MNLENITIKPCPFCGSVVDSYKDSQDFIYHVTKDKSLWNINCLEIYGGCSVQILGESPEECVEKWNKRVEL